MIARKSNIKTMVLFLRKICVDCQSCKVREIEEERPALSLIISKSASIRLAAASSHLKNNDILPFISMDTYTYKETPQI